MKYKKQISKNYHKAIALLLVFYFIITPLLLAFPNEKCSTACYPDMNNGAVEMQMNTANNTPCIMMESVKIVKVKNFFDTEFNLPKCLIDKKDTSNPNYINSVKYFSPIDLQQASVIHQYLLKNDLQLFESDTMKTHLISVPIYKTKSCFLI